MNNTETSSLQRSSIDDENEIEKNETKVSSQIREHSKAPEKKKNS